MTLPGAGAGRLWAATTLAACVVLFLAPATLGGGQFFFRDVSQNHYPMRAFVAEELASGRLPLWNPYLTFGQPAAANPNYGFLHPTTLLYLVLPFDVAFRWDVVLSFLLAAGGMFWLARDLGAGRPAAWLAAVGFALSGPFASLGNLYNLLSTVAWMPLALVLARRAISRGGVRWTLAAAATIACEIAAGEPLVIAATLGLAVLLAPRPSRTGLRLGMVVLLALLLAAVAALPLLEMLAWSERGLGLGWGMVAKWSTRPLRLAELVIPNLFGHPTQMVPDRYWGEGFFESTLPLLVGIYLGGPVLLLAGVAIGGVGRDRISRNLAGAGALFLLLALGSHGGLFLLLHRLAPGFDSLRYPSKLLVPAALCAALLAARGCDRLCSWEAERMPRSIGISAGLLALVPAIGLGLVLLLPGRGSELLHGPMAAAGPPGGARDALVLPQIGASCAHALVVTTAAALLAWLLARGRGARTSPALLLAALAAADLYAANGSLNPTVDPEWYRVEPRLVRTIQEVDPTGRVFRFPRPAGFGVRQTAGSDASSSGFLWDRSSLRNATALPYRIPLAWDRNSERLHPGAAGILSRRLETSSSEEERLRAWRIGAVRFVLAYREQPGPALRLIDAVRGESTHPLLLYELEDRLPRARVVGRVERCERPWERVLDPEFDPDGSVALPPPAAAPEGTAASAPAEIVRDEPERLEVRTAASFDGWLVLADSFYPGWIAEVDGRPATIEPAYGMFRAVPLPAGGHVVTFRYSPSSWRAGLALGAAGLLGCALVALRRRRLGTA